MVPPFLLFYWVLFDMLLHVVGEVCLICLDELGPDF